MKTITSVITVALLTALLLSSCDAAFTIAKRRYTGGFYINTSGRNGSALKNSSEQALQIADTCTIIAMVEQKECPDPVTENALIVSKADSTVDENGDYNRVTSPVLHEQDIRNPHPASAPPDEEEGMETKRAFWFALAGYLLLFVCAFIWLFSIPAFWIFLALAMACAITGFVYARKAKAKHEPGEKYPGKWKRIAAIFVLIQSILVAFLAVVIAIGTR